MAGGLPNELPPSTLHLLTDYACGVRSPSALREWADDAIAAGLDGPAVIDAAILEDDELARVPDALAKALEAVGLSLEDGKPYAAIRQILFARLRDSSLDPGGVIAEAWTLGCRLRRDGENYGREIADWVNLSDEILMLEGQKGDPDEEFHRLGVRRWGLAYLQGDIRGVLNQVKS